MTTNYYAQSVVFSLLTVILIILIVLLQRRAARRSESRSELPALAVALTVLVAGFVVLAIGMFRGSDLVMSLGIEVTGAGLTTVVLEWLLRPLQREREIGVDTSALRSEQRDIMQRLLEEMRQVQASVEDVRRVVSESK